MHTICRSCITVSYTHLDVYKRQEVELDVSQCPDLVPPLAVQAALRPGQTTRIVGAARLRMKESDRLSAVTQVLNALGSRVEAVSYTHLDVYKRQHLRRRRVRRAEPILRYALGEPLSLIHI